MTTVLYVYTKHMTLLHKKIGLIGLTNLNYSYMYRALSMETFVTASVAKFSLLPICPTH